MDAVDDGEGTPWLVPLLVVPPLAIAVGLGYAIVTYHNASYDAAEKSRNKLRADFQDQAPLGEQRGTRDFGEFYVEEWSNATLVFVPHINEDVPEKSFTEGFRLPGRVGREYASTLPEGEQGLKPVDLPLGLPTPKKASDPSDLYRFERGVMIDRGDSIGIFKCDPGKDLKVINARDSEVVGVVVDGVVCM